MNSIFWVFIFSVKLATASASGEECINKLPTEADFTKCRSEKVALEAIPINYTIEIKILSPEENKFEGKVEMVFMVSRNKTTLHLSAKNLTFLSVEIRSLESNEIIPISSHYYNEHGEVQFFRLGNALIVGKKYMFSSNYLGLLHGDMGLLKLNGNGGNGNIYVTKMHPEGARRVFPSIDTMNAKATFTIRVVTSKDNAVLSNMPEESKLCNNGIESVEFETTSLLAPSDMMLIVLPASFESISKCTRRVWMDQSNIDRAKNVSEGVRKILNVLNGIFNERNILQKLDIVVVSKSSGLTQSITGHGLSIFVEESLFPGGEGEDESGFALLSYILARQLIPGLATPHFKDNFWIVEGFANYMSLHITEKVFSNSELRIKMFSLRKKALGQDSKETATALQPFNFSPYDPVYIIMGIKAFSLFEMLEAILGKEILINGLQKILEKFAFDSFTPSDFFCFLQTIYEEKGGQNLPADLEVLMKGWVINKGFPVLKVSRDEKSKSFVVTRVDGGNTSLWIPLTYITSQDPDFTDASPKAWINHSEVTVVLKDTDECDVWIIVNSNLAVYARVIYDEDILEEIIEQLNSDFSLIPFLIRAQLIDDSFHHLTEENVENVCNFLSLISYLENETDSLALETAFGHLDHLDAVMDFSHQHGKFRTIYLTPIIEAQIDRDFGSNATEIQKSELMYAWACRLRLYAFCERLLSNYLGSWISSGKDISKFPEIGRTHYFCAALRNETDHVWDEVWKAYAVEINPATQRIYSATLACSENETQIEKYLDRTLEEFGGKNLTVDKVSNTFYSLILKSRWNSKTWTFIREKFVELKERYGFVPIPPFLENMADFRGLVAVFAQNLEQIFSNFNFSNVNTTQRENLALRLVDQFGNLDEVLASEIIKGNVEQCLVAHN